MDKVIIDGVDVSECPNLGILEDKITGKKTFFCNCHQDDCSEQKNCYYKQLQRLKEENKHLTEKEEEAKQKYDEWVLEDTDER